MAERWLIRAPAKQEAEEILGRTEEIYRRHRDHRAVRLNQAPDILMLIERGGRTLGSLGLFEAAEGELLPTEHLFGVDLRARFPRSRLFEIGRLVATDRSRAGMPLLTVSTVICVICGSSQLS